ncbi:MAG: tRNA (N6-threonylcarbamoyladenosine(37)-N6)-methyltransferase TrmO [Deltaproteobacteria bacterium]|nr:tRNA (N6-threonylcarbamoyladenosine(37)-N6)-methyltransferase TrmO [Deltaproteobacteria bacterium]
MESIGTIASPYKQRFAIPRQPGLVNSARAKIYLNPRFSKDAVKGIDEFSHIWVIFKFHESRGQTFKEVVRPPKLGGKVGRGVFATRSPFRPNDIGLSVVKLLGYGEEGKQVVLEVEGGDFLDGTPVYDIKPYVPYADALEDATSEWAQNEEPRITVKCDVELLTLGFDNEDRERFNMQVEFIRECLSLDPRPAHERGMDAREGQTWGVILGDFEVKFTVQAGVLIITQAYIENCV